MALKVMIHENPFSGKFLLSFRVFFFLYPSLKTLWTCVKCWWNDEKKEENSPDFQAGVTATNVSDLVTDRPGLSKYSSFLTGLAHVPPPGNSCLPTHGDHVSNVKNLKGGRRGNRSRGSHLRALVQLRANIACTFGMESEL